MSGSQHTPTPWFVQDKTFVVDSEHPTNRHLVASVLGSDHNAAFIVEAVNSHDDLVGALRDIARRAEDETLGIQAARLTAIANQAHAAIKDSEAPA